MLYDPRRQFHITLFNFICTTHEHIQTSFHPRLLTNYVPKYVLLSTYIRCLPHISIIQNFFISLLSHLTLCVQIVSLLAYASISTHALMRFFKIGLKQNSTTTLTNISQYIPFLANGLYSTTKTSHHYI